MLMTTTAASHAEACTGTAKVDSQTGMMMTRTRTLVTRRTIGATGAPEMIGTMVTNASSVPPGVKALAHPCLAVTKAALVGLMDAAMHGAMDAATDAAMDAATDAATDAGTVTGAGGTAIHAVTRKRRVEDGKAVTILAAA